MISVFLGGPFRHGARLGSVYFHRGEFNFFLDAKLQELGLVGQQVILDLRVDPRRPELIYLDLRYHGLLHDALVAELVELETSKVVVDHHAYRSKVLNKLLSVPVALVWDAIHFTTEHRLFHHARQEHYVDCLHVDRRFLAIELETFHVEAPKGIQFFVSVD